MTLQAVAHHVFPASIRDIGTGVYHLAKDNATEEQCRKLAAGTLRVSVAALAAIAVIASIALLPPAVGTIAASLIFLPIRLLDTETSSLLIGAAGISLGLTQCAIGVSLLAQGIFDGALDLLCGAFLTGASWVVTRVPRDIEYSFKGLFAEDIDNWASNQGLIKAIP